MSKTVIFKVESNHISKNLKQEVEKIVSAINQEPIENIAIEMDFRVYAHGGRMLGPELANDQSYIGILANKKLVGYPIDTPSGTRCLYDGDWAIDKICEAIAGTKIATVDFSGSFFYPGSLEAILKLKGNYEIKDVSFKNCIFFNVDSRFFVDNFVNTGIAIKLDGAIIYQKGEKLGVVGGGSAFEEHFASLDSDNVEGIEVLGNSDF